MTRSGGNLNDRPSRLSIFAKRQRRRVRPALLVGLVIALGTIGAITVHDMQSEERFAPIRAKLIRLAPLKVTSLQISGRSLTSLPSLMTALGTDIGQPMLGFSITDARSRIDALPFVDHATVERHMPGTIIVTLVERRPFAVWQHDGHFMLIDRSGQQVADQGMTGKDAAAFMQLPLVVGVGANDAAADLLDALAAQPDVQSRTSAAVRVGGRRWNLTLKSGATVLLPENEEAPALARLVQYQQQFKLLDRPVIAIDLRLPDRMVVRPRPVPPPDTTAAPTTPPTDADKNAADPPSSSTDVAPHKPATATPVTSANAPGPSHDAPATQGQNVPHQANAPEQHSSTNDSMTDSRRRT